MTILAEMTIDQKTACGEDTLTLNSFPPASNPGIYFSRKAYLFVLAKRFSETRRVLCFGSLVRILVQPAVLKGAIVEDSLHVTHRSLVRIG